MSYVYLIKKFLKRILYFCSTKKYKAFHSFPFNPNEPLPMGSFDYLLFIIDNLPIIDDSLVRISDGTLLGLFRNGKLIPHDNDLDFDLFNYDHFVIKKLAINNNWTLGREVFYMDKCQQLTYYTSENLVIDFIFWYKDGPFAVNFSENHYIRVQPLNFLIESEIIVMANHKFIVPKQLESWLVYRYGQNWSIPNTVKSDWKLDCGDLIKIS